MEKPGVDYSLEALLEKPELLGLNHSFWKQELDENLVEISHLVEEDAEFEAIRARIQAQANAYERYKASAEELKKVQHADVA